jgi:hypothetical protein
VIDDKTLIEIRERTFLDLLDLAMVVVRRRPRTVLLAGLAGVAPFVVINTYFTNTPDFSTLYYAALLALEAPWATAPLTVALGGLMFGERLTAGQVARAVARGLPGMIAYQLLIRGFFVVTVLLYPLMPSKLVFLNEVILLERGGIGAAIKRCSTLTGNRGGDFFGQWLAQLFFGSFFVAAFWFGSGAALSALTTSTLSWEEPGWGVLYSLRGQLAVWTAVVFFAVARFLMYIDQRIRLEGWEVKLRLQAVGRSLEEPARW